ncbi:MAG TPA: MBL fold metallo-hydrolase [Candidatus Limnocylindrales bacterium]|nr:MBL fold metallo-hydrolase [Candidatus Limnocylindrales bacterium]
MKITKLSHSCLLVEMPEPVSRTVLFDPGMMSEPLVDVESLVYLDDIIITHGHPDHLSIPLVQKLLQKFPEVRITAPPSVVVELKQHDVFATSEAYEGIQFFKSLHEQGDPLFETPEQIGVHYLGMLSHPGDSHSFTETCPILALPVTAPWGAAVRAVNLTIELKPTYVLPIHDWHWSEAAREQMYGRLEQILTPQGIEFIPLKDGEPYVIKDVTPQAGI